MRTPILARVFRRVRRDEVTGCWLWTGCVLPAGHGQIREAEPRRTRLVHRVVYEALVGPVPEGLELDHLCRRPACVNPAHLEPVTHRENILRGEAPSAQLARRTTCHRGHPLTGANLGTATFRRCLTCHRIAEKARYARDPATYSARIKATRDPEKKRAYDRAYGARYRAARKAILTPH